MSIRRIIRKAVGIEWSWIVSATMHVEENRLRYLCTGSIPESCYIHCLIDRAIKFRIPPFGNVELSSYGGTVRVSQSTIKMVSKERH